MVLRATCELNLLLFFNLNQAKRLFFGTAPERAGFDRYQGIMGVMAACKVVCHVKF